MDSQVGIAAKGKYVSRFVTCLTHQWGTPDGQPRCKLARFVNTLREQWSLVDFREEAGAGDKRLMSANRQTAVSLSQNVQIAQQHSFSGKA